MKFTPEQCLELFLRAYDNFIEKDDVLIKKNLIKIGASCAFIGSEIYISEHMFANSLSINISENCILYNRKQQIFFGKTAETLNVGRFIFEAKLDYTKSDKNDLYEKLNFIISQNIMSKTGTGKEIIEAVCDKIVSMKLNAVEEIVFREVNLYADDFYITVNCNDIEKYNVLYHLAKKGDKLCDNVPINEEISLKINSDKLLEYKTVTKNDIDIIYEHNCPKLLDREIVCNSIPISDDNKTHKPKFIFDHKYCSISCLISLAFCFLYLIYILLNQIN